MTQYLFKNELKNLMVKVLRVYSGPLYRLRQTKLFSTTFVVHFCLYWPMLYLHDLSNRLSKTNKVVFVKKNLV